MLTRDKLESIVHFLNCTHNMHDTKWHISSQNVAMDCPAAIFFNEPSLYTSTYDQINKINFDVKNLYTNFAALHGFSNDLMKKLRTQLQEENHKKSAAQLLVNNDTNEGLLTELYDLSQRYLQSLDADITAQATLDELASSKSTDVPPLFTVKDVMNTIQEYVDPIQALRKGNLFSVQDSWPPRFGLAFKSKADCDKATQSIHSLLAGEGLQDMSMAYDHVNKSDKQAGDSTFNIEISQEVLGLLNKPTR